MKRRMLWLGIILTACLMPASPLTAQLNCFSFSSDLAQYNYYSTDGTSIYTTVLVDGSEQMNAWGQCLQFWGYAVHTAYAFNRLSTNEQTVGGWSSGNGVCASCYISAGDDEYITPLPGEQVNFENEAFADCSFGGTFFETSLDDIGISLSPAVTVGSMLRCVVGGFEGRDLGTYVPACSSGTPACPLPVQGLRSWEIAFGEGEFCWNYARTAWIVVRVNGNVDECFANLVSLEASGPGACY